MLPISQFSIFVLASLAYHDYEGVALRDDEKPRLVADLGDKTYLMLRNHGLLTVGPTIAAAFGAMYVFETTCAVQIRAQAGGSMAAGDLIEIDADVLRTATEQARLATLGKRRRRADLAGAAAPPRPPRPELSPLSIEALPFQQRQRPMKKAARPARRRASASSSCRAAARSAPTRPACSRRSRR